ncbi:putative actin patch assembly and actin polymerization protein [Acarospora aff. strigata]|nr:putative actin patch assembly and actin polymerization protein [Acarospora aff. strigata]
MSSAKGSAEPSSRSLHPRHTLRKSAHKASAVSKSRIEKKTQPQSKPTRDATRSQDSSSSSLLIRVFVNNRLGTRVSIPCSPSDTVSDFKKLVAFQVGTRPDAIMLKRQGQRALRGELTLADYEIGNGTSLDLGVDTGGD